MYKKTITFEDFNGNKRTGDYYFNISEAEFIEMDMNESQMQADGGISGGLSEKLEQIRKGGSGREILAAFKDILFLSYGIKSDDGLVFEKSAEISRRFEQSGAYNEFFTELVTDAGRGAEFIKATLPAKFTPSINKAMQDKPVPGSVPAPDTTIVTAKKEESISNEPKIVIDTPDEKKISDQAIADYIARQQGGAAGPLGA